MAFLTCWKFREYINAASSVNACSLILSSIFISMVRSFTWIHICEKIVVHHCNCMANSVGQIGLFWKTIFTQAQLKKKKIGLHFTQRLNTLKPILLWQYSTLRESSSWYCKHTTSLAHQLFIILSSVTSVHYKDQWLVGRKKPNFFCACDLLFSW